MRCWPQVWTSWLTATSLRSSLLAASQTVSPFRRSKLVFEWLEICWRQLIRARPKNLCVCGFSTRPCQCLPGMSHSMAESVRFYTVYGRTNTILAYVIPLQWYSPSKTTTWLVQLLESWWKIQDVANAWIACSTQKKRLKRMPSSLRSWWSSWNLMNFKGFGIDEKLGR